MSDGVASCSTWPLVHDGHHVGEDHRLLLVVGDDDGGEVELLLEFAQPDLHGLAQVLVEGAEGFVEQQDVGPGDDGAGEGGALLLAAGEFVQGSAGRRLERRTMARASSTRAVRSAAGTRRICRPKAAFWATVMWGNRA